MDPNQQQQHNANRLSGHFDFTQEMQTGQTIDPKVFGSAAPNDLPMYQDHSNFFDHSPNSPSHLQQGFPQGDYTLYSNAEQPQVQHSPYLNPSEPASNVNPQDLMNPHTPPMQQHRLSLQPDDIHQEWQYINESQQFNQYRRAPSEISDISSANVSPFISTVDYSNHPSPLITAEGTSMTEFLQMDSFNLSETHSPIMSPHLSPVYHSRSASPYNAPPDAFQFPPPQQPTALHLDPPVVNVSEQPTQPIQGPAIMVDFAPPQRQPTFPNNPKDESALTVKGKKISLF